MSIWIKSKIGQEFLWYLIRFSSSVKERKKIQLKIFKRKTFRGRVRGIDSANLCLCCIYWISVSVFLVSTSLIRSSGKRTRLHTCMRRCACAASMEHVFLFRRFLLGWSGTQAGLLGSLNVLCLSLCNLFKS